MPDTTPGQRFIQLIQQLGLTKNAFAQSLGKTATVIQHIVDERNKPGYDLLNRVCEVYPNVSSEWLLRGLGPMMRAGNSASMPITAPPSPTDGINLDEVPHAPRRRSGNLLQPADIAATLALTTPPPNGTQHPAAPAAAVATAAAATAATADAPAAPPPISQPPAPPPISQPPAAPASVPVPVAAAAAPVPTLPDPTYLAAALQTQHLQHQLALAEQRNQHLLEQQALLRQMVELLKV